VLAQPITRSWVLCAPLNRFLTIWQQRAADGKLEVSRWARTADGWLSGHAYAARFLRIERQHPLARPTRQDALNAQSDFFEKNLAAVNNYPLLWESKV
jgi:hypothetical protein